MGAHESFATVIDAVSSKTLDYSLLLAAIGTLSMAFMELLKGLFSLRRHFHQYQFNRWICNHNTREEMLILAAGGKQYSDVLFDQPTEQMMGQIQAAANLSLEYPDRYPHVYEFMTEEDLSLQYGSFAGEKNDNELWRTFAEKIVREGIPAPDELSVEHEKVAREAQQARARIGNLIARRLDMFQNRTQYRWARTNQVVTIVMGSSLSAYVLNSARETSNFSDNFALLSLALLAGMLAPFSKDVVSAISGLRTRA